MASPAVPSSRTVRRQVPHHAATRRATGLLYRPRRPTTTPLYSVVQHHLETFLATAQESDRRGYGVPSWVERDFRFYPGSSPGQALRCGVLAHGFARARCPQCGHERLVPYSCKARGACPSCNGRRMAHTPRNRLRGDPGSRSQPISATTCCRTCFANRLPRMYHPWRQIEVDEGGVPPADSVRGHRVGDASVDLSYFDVLGTGVLSGRGFHSGDLEAGLGVVIVNQSFVGRVLGGRNPLGRRVRYVASEEYRSPEQEPSPWYEIVGVVGDLGMNSGYGRAGLYHPIAPSGAYPVQMAVRVRGEPESFAPRLRALATAVDPALRLYDLQPLNEVNQGEVVFYEFWFRLTFLVSSIALLLSLVGIYSVMSFTVSRRTREIGIRVALGSDRKHIFRRPLAQVALGVVAGAVVVAAMARVVAGSVSVKGPRWSWRTRHS